MTRWKLCKWCRLDTRCENQDRDDPCWFERQPQYILFKDCQTLAQKLLQVKPELRDWIETNFKEYLNE